MTSVTSYAHKCSNGKNVMDVMNHFLTGFKAHCTVGNICLIFQTWPRNHGWGRGPWNEPIPIILLNKHCIKLPSKSLSICRTVQLSDHIREVSLWSRRGQRIHDWSKFREYPVTTGPPHHTPLPRLRDHCRRGGTKSHRSQKTIEKHA